MILIAAAWTLYRRAGAQTAVVGTATFMLFCVSWVLAVTLLVDGSEANRLRFSTQPYLLLLAVWAVESAWRGRKAAPRAEAS